MRLTPRSLFYTRNHTGVKNDGREVTALERRHVVANRGPRPSPPGYLSRRELADRWGVSERTVTSYLSGRRPKVPSALIGGRRLVRLSDVEAYERLQFNGNGKLGPAGVCNARGGS